MIRNNIPAESRNGFALLWRVLVVQGVACGAGVTQSTLEKRTCPVAQRVIVD